MDRKAKPLTREQETLVLATLQANHAYYVGQGMSRAHMWPAELLDEIRKAIEQGQAIDWSEHQGAANAQP